MVVLPHRFEGVFVSKGKADSLLTRNMVPRGPVYGAKRMEVTQQSKEKIEYGIWNPFPSKLGATLVGGGVGDENAHEAGV